MQWIPWLILFALMSCLYLVEPRQHRLQQPGRVKGSSKTPACLDERGNQVDWYIAYKFPDLSAQKRPFDTGFAYAYITSDRLSAGNQHNDNDSYWTISSLLVSDRQSLIMQTLALAYQDRPDGNPNSIFYSDQPPKEDKNDTSGNTSRAHAKGVLLIDDITGRSIWLTHSVSPSLGSYLI